MLFHLTGANFASFYIISDIFLTFQEKQKNTCLTSHLEVFLLQPLCCNSLAKFFVKIKWWIMFLLLNFSREACQNVKKCITFHAQTPKANFCHKKCVFENCHLCTYLFGRNFCSITFHVKSFYIQCSFIRTHH